MLRVLLIRISQSEHLLLLSCYHIVVDGWSMGVLISELLRLYEAFASGRPSPLPELPFQYADLAVWQRERLSGPALEAQLDAWCKTLEGAPRLWSFPLDRPRPPVLSHRGGQILRLLPRELIDRVKAMATSERASLYMVLFASFALLIHRWSGQEDVVIGSPVAGRERQESEGVIGPFVTLLPARVDLSGRPSFRELLRRTRETLLHINSIQEVSLERLIEAMGLKREPSHYPIFQCVVNMLNFPSHGGELPGGIEVEPLPPTDIVSKYDFIVYATDTPAGLHLNFAYALDLFDRPRMEALLDQLKVVLEMAADHPEKPIDRFRARAPQGQDVLA